MTKPKVIRCSEVFLRHELLATTSRKAWARVCRKSLADAGTEHAPPDGTDGHTIHADWATGGRVVMVWIAPDLTTDIRAGVIAHEAAHAARFILDAIGETTRTDEIEPYLIGDITTAIWRMIHQEGNR